LRAAFLLGSLLQFRNHRGYQVLNRYFSIRKENRELHTRVPAFKQLKTSFDTILEKTLQLRTYIYVSRESEIVSSFENNIPFVAKDIREFINSLPPKTDSLGSYKFNSILSGIAATATETI
jgi:hypothetical protein